MYRYIFFTDDYPVVTCKHCYEDQNENYCGPAIERLAEYEATGLMPAEVAALQYQLRHAKGAQQWIPVTERLPEYGQEVLVYTGNILKPVVMTFTFWRKDYGTWLRVTHWMPLPEPPKEVE